MQPLEAGEPRTIGAYRLLGRLGAGGMGRVYLGRSAGGRTVAVKVVHPHFALDEQFRARFRHEVEAARRVGGRWTAPVLDADPDAPVPWVATGYVAGPSLTQAVLDRGPLPERSVRVLGAGLAEALAAVHALGLVHRDVKPSNVLLTLDGPRLIDFGIARATEGTASLTATGVSIGSPGYMAPEQILSRQVTGAADVFSLGAVLAYAATGRPPFPGDSSAALLYKVVHESAELGAGLTGELRDVVAGCLAKDPAARPSPTALAARLAPAGAAALVGEGWLPGPLVEEVSRSAVRLLDLEPEEPATGSGPIPFTSPAIGGSAERAGPGGPAVGGSPTAGVFGPPGASCDRDPDPPGNLRDPDPIPPYGREPGPSENRHASDPFPYGREPDRPENGREPGPSGVLREPGPFSYGRDPGSPGDLREPGSFSYGHASDPPGNLHEPGPIPYGREPGPSENRHASDPLPYGREPDRPENGREPGPFPGPRAPTGPRTPPDPRTRPGGAGLQAPSTPPRPTAPPSNAERHSRVALSVATAAEPGERGRGRRVSCTVVLAVAGALAGVTVGGAFLAGLLPNGGGDADHTSARPPASSGTASTPPGTPGSGQPGTGPQLGSVPSELVGTWKGVLTQDNGTSGYAYTAVITKGAKGTDVVRTTTTLGPLVCHGIGTLDSATARVLHITERTDPANPGTIGCTGGTATMTYTLQPDGTLRFESQEAEAGRPTGVLGKQGG
nr:serine/threonine-protein kinase [Streptomyces hundungensis]